MNFSVRHHLQNIVEENKKMADPDKKKVKFSWKIFCKKAVIYGGVTVIGGVLSVWAENPYVLALAPLLLLLQNFLKHKLGWSV